MGILPVELERSHSVSTHVRRAVSRADAGAVAAALAARPGAVFFDSSDVHDRWGRYTIAACEPLAEVSLREGRLSGAFAGPAVGAEAHGAAGAANVRWPAGGVETFTVALRRLLRFARAPRRDDVAYAPGWMGYLGYELGRHFERLPGRASGEGVCPDMRLGFYDAVAVFDHHAGAWDLVALRFGDPPPGAGRAEAELRDVLRRAERTAFVAAPVLSPAEVEAVFDRPGLVSDFTPDAYRVAVARCVDYIAAGDIFQANLSQRFTQPTTATPEAIYRCLRRSNPCWYGGYVLGDGWAVLSSSPELFLRCRGRRVVTRPIKGTSRRRGGEGADSRAAAALLASAKDNAELAMIVDLMRNDLGRVCRLGGVRVVRPRVLEAHPTVFHLVGEVAGELREGADLADVIAATFPGGSITGAPKIRAMEIIDELEPVARGPYTGSMAHFGVDGSAELNIVIRTAVWTAGRVDLHVGGGIVADSTCDGEYGETLDKARAVLAAVAAAERLTGGRGPCIRTPRT